MVAPWRLWACCVGCAMAARPIGGFLHALTLLRQLLVVTAIRLGTRQRSIGSRCLRIFSLPSAITAIPSSLTAEWAGKVYFNV